MKVRVALVLQAYTKQRLRCHCTNCIQSLTRKRGRGEGNISCHAVFKREFSGLSVSPDSENVMKCNDVRLLENGGDIGFLKGGLIIFLFFGNPCPKAIVVSNLVLALGYSC